MEAGAVAAYGVSADGRRGVLELLRDVFDQRLAVHTLKSPADLRPQTSLRLFKELQVTVVCQGSIVENLTSSGCTGCVLTT